MCASVRERINTPNVCQCVNIIIKWCLVVVVVSISSSGNDGGSESMVYSGGVYIYTASRRLSGGLAGGTTTTTRTRKMGKNKNLWAGCVGGGGSGWVERVGRPVGDTPSLPDTAGGGGVFANAR